MKKKPALTIILLLAVSPVIALKTFSLLENSSTTSESVSNENEQKSKLNYGSSSNNNRTMLPSTAAKPKAKIAQLESMTSSSSGIHTLDYESNNEKLQEELAKVIKAQAKKSRSSQFMPLALQTKSIAENRNSTENRALKELVEAEDMVYNDELEGEDEDDEEYDEEDEDDVDDDENDDIDEEEITLECPSYCKCIGQYAAVTTAKCSKLFDDKLFGSRVAHLRIENAGNITLGSHALSNLGLNQLESITFVDSKITELHRTAFDKLPYLFAVNLTRTELTYIHPHTFQNNSQLSLLTISGNPFKFITGISPNEYLLDAPNVTELDFSANIISRLPRMAFSKMRNLAYINLKNNGLQNIDKGTFKHLESLVELDLSNNLLDEIPIDLFDAKCLETLRISGNNLTNLATVKASKLTTLDVSTNAIKEISKDDLIGLPFLDQLHIRGNGIKRIHQHAFSNLDQLTYLDISKNELTSLTQHHFRANSRLQIILISDNAGLESLPIFRTDAQQFETFSIYRFECANCGLAYIEPTTFDAMPAMTRLNLAQNHLDEIPRNFLKNLTSLRELDLSENRLTNLEDDMFRGATNLNKLNIAGNHLTVIPVTPFLLMPELIRLNVSNCGLHKIWSGNFTMPLKNLRFMSAGGNHLQRISTEELDITPKLSGLDISKNPIKCDLHFYETVQWLIDHNVTPTNTPKYISNLDNLENYAEAQVVRQWSDLAKLVCENIKEKGPPKRNPVKKTIKEPIYRSSLDIKSNHHIFQRISKTSFSTFNFDNTDYQQEYEEYNPIYRHWYNGAIWPVITIVLVTLAILLVAAHFAICLAKRRGGSLVIRTPMILRPGLIDSKNCGLVYKPLQEEISTQPAHKRGSFYSSSTFHYDKIVPESV